ncbi:MAG: alpha/beta hydrolase [Thermoplasmata archaeon]
MPFVDVNEVRLFYEVRGGEGDPLILIHGSWVDHTTWNLVAPRLAESFQLLLYDRRGHSQSGPATIRGSIVDDALDLAALLESTGLYPAHILGSSMGGSVVLRLAERRPELFRSLLLHEPPVYDLVRDDPVWGPKVAPVRQLMEGIADLIRRGKPEDGAREFWEAFGGSKGVWERLRPEVKSTFVANAPTWLEEFQDPSAISADPVALGEFLMPALLSNGANTVPWLQEISDRLAALLPNVTRRILPNTGHLPHLTNPDLFLGVVQAFCLERTIPTS